jgi:glycosyltransferase involved in cell wall biosynthesis
MKVYRYSSYIPNALGHGGEKRSQQIIDCFKKAGLVLEELTPNTIAVKKSFITRKINKLIYSYRFIRRFDIKIKSINHFRQIGSHLAYLKDIIINIQKGSTIIYEHHSGVDWLVPLVLKGNGCKIICIPHNLETLVPKQTSRISSTRNPDGFFDEIKLFSKMDMVLTISKEEEWLLRLFGINAFYFPFVPSKQVDDSLKLIASKRSNRKSNGHFLIFGTYGNTPTRKGMIELLDHITQPTFNQFVFHIAGFGTEKLKDTTRKLSNFHFYGSVTTDHLFKLYESVDAAIIHQIPTTGALTKIPELLIAGVPVIANTNSARNYFNVMGMHIYAHLSYLKENLEQIKFESSIKAYTEEINLDKLFLFIKNQIEN